MTDREPGTGWGKTASPREDRQRPALPSPEPLSLFDPATLVTPKHDGPVTIQEAFEAFHAANPQVYRRLRQMALELVERGHQRISIAMLWETLRYQVMSTSDATSSFRLNNNFRSRFARQLLKEPGLQSALETRSLKTP